MDLREFKDSRFASSPHLILIGNPVSHSLSPLMHNAAAKYYNLPLRYYAVRVDDEDFPLLPVVLANDQLVGANVTIPHKQQMLGYVDSATDQCKKIGAVNTIVKQNGKLAGHNTDIQGFCKPLQPFQSELKNSRAIVFGTGGAARAVWYGLKMLSIDEIILVSRTSSHKTNRDWPSDISLVSCNQWQDFAPKTALFVNATPLGMAPNIETSPVKESEKDLLANKICYDIVYNPVETTFLRRAKEAGATTIDGLEMFIQQGSRSFELWTGKSFPIKLVRQELMKALCDGN